MEELSINDKLEYWLTDLLSDWWNNALYCQHECKAAIEKLRMEDLLKENNIFFHVPRIRFKYISSDQRDQNVYIFWDWMMNKEYSAVNNFAFLSTFIYALS